MFFRNAMPGGILVFSCLFSGCALVPGLHVDADGSHLDTDPGYEVVEITPDVIAAQKLVATKSFMDEDGLVPANPANPPSEYRIGSGDVLQIVVWDHMELTNPFGAVTRDPVSAGQLVAADGTLSFPYAGVLDVAGKTVQEIRDALVDRLKPVVTKPQVDVRVAAFRAGRVQVTGEVRNPGLVTMDDTVKGVLEAINERGGINPDTASRRSALLIRNGKSYVIDLAGLLSGARPAVNPRLEPGDIVHVPDTSEDQVFVLGEVSRQGPVVLSQQQTTLIEALTKTGGLDKTTANDSGVLVFRRPIVTGQPAQIFAVDLSQPTGLLLADEFPLVPRDVIYVKATKFAQYNLIISQLLPTITSIYYLDRLDK
ncbi:MAG: polysaccharide biosynthesis/export family protein [Solimonas sp.]